MLRGGKIVSDLVHHHRNGLGTYHRQPLGFAHHEKLVAVLFRERLPDRFKVVARIEAFRNRTDILTERLAIPQERGTPEHIDLRAGVVDVIFAGDIVAAELEQARQRIAEHGAAAMADMHRTGRIGRDVFDIDLGAATNAAVIGALAQHRPQCLRPGGGYQRQIDEAGTGDIDLGDQRIGAEPLGDLLGEVTGLCLCLFRKHHGGVGRHVAMGGIARRLDHHAREIDALGPVGFRRERAADGVHACEHVGEQMRC
ncbi:hypothetical protein V1280_001499 [Bradyrhizobium sp. AZCC 2230]